MTDRHRSHVAPDALVEHVGFVRSLARSLVSNIDAAEDVAQETWVSALAHAPRSSASVRQWLAAIVRNVVRQERRTVARRARREEACARPGRDPELSAGEALEKLEASRALVAAVGELSRANRTVVVMRFYDSLSPREIAASLDLTTDAVKARLKRALAELRLRLGVDVGAHGNEHRKELGEHRHAVNAAPVLLKLAELPAAASPAGAALTLGSLIMSKAKIAAVAVLIGILAGGAVLFVTMLDDDSARKEMQRADVPTDGPREPRAMPHKPAQSGDATPAATVADASTPASQPAPDDPLPFSFLTVHGRVVDQRQWPVADAIVNALLLDRVVATTRSASDGTFTLEGIPRHKTEDLRGGVFAYDGKGNARAVLLPTRSRQGCVWAAVNPSYDHPEGNDVVLTLLPAHPVDVLVTDEGTPVSNALVRLEWGPALVLADVGTTDAAGRLHIPWMPDADLVVRAATPSSFGQTRCSHPQDPQGPIVVSLRPTRTVHVTVIESGSMAPIEGAVLRLMEFRSVAARDQADGYGPASFPLARDIRSTGSDGRTTIENVPDGLDRLYILVSRRGYVYGRDPNREPVAGLRLADSLTEIELRMMAVAYRSVRIPVVDGQAPVPADGTVLRLRDEPRGFYSPASDDRPVQARIEGSSIVIDGVPDGSYQSLAEAPDGALASVVLGREASFRPARRVTARVHHTDGTPAEGIGVTLRSEGGSVRCLPAMTDASGVATIENLYEDLVDVVLTHPRHPSLQVPVGTVDLSERDGSIDAVVPREARLVLQILVGGQPALPPDLEIRCPMGHVYLEKEHPETGLCDVVLLVPPNTENFRVWAAARGYAFVFVDVPLEHLDTGVPVTMELGPWGSITATIDRPWNGLIHVVLEEWKDAEDRWVAADYPVSSGMRAPNTLDGGFRFEQVRPGRYRVVERESGLASEAVVLPPGGSDMQVTLSLESTTLVAGRVIAPEGTDMMLVRVLVEADGLLPPDDDDSGYWNGRGGMAKGHTVSHHGDFQICVPTDRPVRLTAWHPVLAPADPGGSIAVNARTGLVRLGLAEGNKAAFAVPEGAWRGSQRTPGLTVKLYHGEPDGPPLQTFFAIVMDDIARFGGFEPGTYTLWIDPFVPKYAPVVLRGVELRAGQQELRDVHFETGSSIRMRIQLPDGSASPRIHLSAHRLEEPRYMRQMKSDGEAEVVLSGLGPGTFELTWQPSRFQQNHIPNKQVVTVDGKADLVLDIDPR